MTGISVIKAGGLRSVVRTWGFMNSVQRLGLMTAMLLMAAVGYLTASIPIGLGELMDAVFRGKVQSMAQALPFLGVLGIRYLTREVLQTIRRILVEYICTNVEREALVAAIASLLRADVSVLRSSPSGSLNGRINRSVDGLVKLIKLSFLDLLPAIIGAAFALLAALAKDWRVGALMAAVLPVGLILSWLQTQSQRGVRISLMAAKEQLDGSIVEQIGGIETVRVAHTLELEVDKVRQVSEGLRKAAFQHHQMMAVFDAVKGINEGTFNILVIGSAFWLNIAAGGTAGNVLAFSILFGAILVPLREIHRILDEAHESSLWAEAYFQILDRPPDVSFDAQDRPGCPLGVKDILVEANNLTLGYGAGPSVSKIIDGISFTIRPGETVGLAGPSGGGKSTLIRALTRVVHPTSGWLKIGGVDIQQISRADIGSMIGLVSQTPYLFSGTVAENIAYGSGLVAHADIVAAARKAQIHDEIVALEGGYEGRVTERGENLSGGQRQRIALARIFLRDPPILILDEATAALDNENERAVMAAIGQASKGRTVLMIAHRLPSLRCADRILVLQNGKIVEEGTYDDLASHKGLFSQLLHGTELRGKGVIRTA